MKAAFSPLKFNGMLKPGFQPESRRAEPKFLPDMIWCHEIAFDRLNCAARKRGDDGVEIAGRDLTIRKLVAWQAAETFK